MLIAALRALISPAVGLLERLRVGTKTPTGLHRKMFESIMKSFYNFFLHILTVNWAFMYYRPILELESPLGIRPSP